MMKTVLTIFAALSAVLFSNFASAQCSRVIQNGTVQNNAPVVWVAPCVLGQAGPSTGSGGVGALPMLNDLGIQGNLGILDAQTTGPYHWGLFGWSTTTSGEFDLNLSGLGGASVASMDVILNGIKYPFPGSGNGNVIVSTSPSTPASGDVVEWGGGTTVLDSGINVNNIATRVATISALKAFSLTGHSAGFEIGVNGYSAIGDMPPDAYRLSTSSCSLNAGAGDGGSQIPSNTSNNCWIILPESAYDLRQFGVVPGTTDPGTNAAQIQAAVNFAQGFNGQLVLGGQTYKYTGPITVSSPMTISGPGEFDSGGSTGFSAGGTQFESRTYWLNTGSVTVASAVSALNAQWTGALPIGMMNFSSGATGSTFENITMNCGLQTNCSNIVSNAKFVTMQNLNLSEFSLFGIAGFGNLTGVSNISILQDSNPANWSGVGLGCLYNGAADDSIVGPQIIIQATGIGAVVGCGDFKFFGNHIFPAPVGPSNWNAMVLNTANSTSAVENNTFDNSRVVWQRPSGSPHVGAFQFKGNVFEFGTGGSVDANLVLQCMGSSVCGETSQFLSNIILGGSIPSDADGLILAAYSPVALEDQFGNLNPDAWTVNVQQLWGPAMNACSYSCTNQDYPNTTPTGAQFTFTGNVTNGSFNITNSSILPTQGTSLTVSGCGATVTNGKITDISFSENRIWYAGTTTGTGSGCTISVGSLTLTGSIASATNNIISSITGLPAFGLYAQVTDSGACIPSNSWISGENEFTGTVIFHNLTPTAASCSSTNDTITVTPYHYYLAPSDSSELLVANSTNNTTVFLRDDIPRGSFVDITPRNGPNSVILNPIGSATINAGTGNLTLIDNSNAVDHLVTASQSPSKYSIINGAIAMALGPASLTGFGTGVAFSPASPGSTQGFGIDVGTTAGSSGTIHFTQMAPNGWTCSGSNTTTPADNLVETSYGTQTAQISNYSAGVLTNFADHALLILSCTPF